MGNYVNGYQYPQIVIKGVETNNTVETISLDLCNEGGLTEEYTEDFKRNELESGGYVDFDFRGSRIIFTLDYSEYVRKNNLFNIEKIFAYNSNPNSYKLQIRPRADVLGRTFEVRLYDGKYSLGIMKGGINTPGHRLPVIQFITVDTVSKNFLDPDTLPSPLPYNLKTNKWQSL